MRAQRTATAAALALAATGGVRAQAVEARPPAAEIAEPQLAALAREAPGGAATAGGEQTGAAAPEPTLQAVEEAAMRVAAGTAEEDRSREARARASHWAPVLHGQYGIRDDDRARRGEFRLAPLVEDDTGQSRAWAVIATWDVAQIVYSREETQLALTHVHLARVRQQAAAEAAQLYEERWRRRISLRLNGSGSSPERVDALLGLLRATAGLDALTGGLFAAQLAEAEELLAAQGSRLAGAAAISLPPRALSAVPASVPPPLPPLGLFGSRRSADTEAPSERSRRVDSPSAPYTSTVVEEEEQ